MRTAFTIEAMTIVLMIEAVVTSETSVYFYETIWLHIPEGSILITVRI
jgi:hypothetical protein